MLTQFLCKDLIYLLKIQYFIKDYPNVVRFKFSRLFFFGQIENIFFDILNVTASYSYFIDFFAFFWVFSYIIDNHCSCLNYYSSFTFWYINIPNVTAGYLRFSDLICALIRKTICKSLAKIQ